MRLFDLNLEELQDDYKALLKEHLPNALKLVAARYEGTGYELTLEEVVESEYKSGDLVIFQALPAVSVEADFAEAEQGADHSMRVDVSITVWVLSQDPEELDSLSRRYVWAILSAVTGYTPHQVSEVLTPSVEVGNTREETPGLIKGATITLPVLIPVSI